MKELEIIQELTMLIKGSVNELEADINKTTDLSSLNLDSLEFVHVFAEIEKKFNIEFEMDDLIDDKLLIVGNLAKRVSELLEKNR